MESGLFRVKGGNGEIKVRSRLFANHLSWVTTSQLFVILHGGQLRKANFVCDFVHKAFEEIKFYYCLERGIEVDVHLW
jgi:hypothetical protein